MLAEGGQLAPPRSQAELPTCKHQPQPRRCALPITRNTPAVGIMIGAIIIPGLRAMAAAASSGIMPPPPPPRPPPLPIIPAITRSCSSSCRRCSSRLNALQGAHGAEARGMGVRARPSGRVRSPQTASTTSQSTRTATPPWLLRCEGPPEVLPVSLLLQALPLCLEHVPMLVAQVLHNKVPAHEHLLRGV
jgi:hypothetical protein